MAAQPNKANITAQQARELFRYEPDTGRLFLLPRPRDLFSSDKEWKRWNSRYSGQRADRAIKSNGYRMLSLFDREYRIHRVIWLVQTGVWPGADVDHINGVKDDNRWCNLRSVSHAVNLRNQKRNVGNTSGAHGVSWHKQCRKWTAQIKLNGRKLHLGLFETIEAAKEARAMADIKHGFTERHGRAA